MDAFEAPSTSSKSGSGFVRSSAGAADGPRAYNPLASSERGFRRDDPAPEAQSEVYLKTSDKLTNLIGLELGPCTFGLETKREKSYGFVSRRNKEVIFVHFLNLDVLLTANNCREQAEREDRHKRRNGECGRFVETIEDDTNMIY